MPPMNENDQTEDAGSTAQPETSDGENAHARVVMVGDSLTASFDWSTVLPDHEVHNLGVSGSTTDDLPAVLEAIVELAPEEVVVMIGTNDFGTGRNVEHVVRNVEVFLVSLRRELPFVRTLVQSILPRGREFAPRIQDANRHLRQFAATVHAHYLDLWPALAFEDGELNPQFTEDRLHLNPTGYEAWSAELLPALDRLRDAPPMTGSISIIRSA